MIIELRGLLGLLDGKTCGKRPFWLSRLANFFQGTVGACGDAEKVSLVCQQKSDLSTKDVCNPKAWKAFAFSAKAPATRSMCPLGGGGSRRRNRATAP